MPPRAPASCSTPSGEIVTNAHVVTDESSGTRKAAKAVYVEFPDRNVVPAKIVGFDPFADVALLEVNPDGLDLHPLALGDDHDLVVGQPVAAIGSPFGEQHSLSVGVVSATDRSVESLTQFQIEGAIQTDASINPGNSGGPLLDADARVVGINQQIETNSGSNDGVGFAVPISAIKRSVAQLEGQRRGRIRLHRRLHARRSTRSSPKSSASTPTTAACSPKSSPAARPTKAGLKGGDDKLRFQGRRLRNRRRRDPLGRRPRGRPPDDLARYISDLRPGQTGDADDPARRRSARTSR